MVHNIHIATVCMPTLFVECQQDVNDSLERTVAVYNIPLIPPVKLCTFSDQGNLTSAARIGQVRVLCYRKPDSLNVKFYKKACLLVAAHHPHDAMHYSHAQLCDHAGTAQTHVCNLDCS